MTIVYGKRTAPTALNQSMTSLASSTPLAEENQYRTLLTVMTTTTTTMTWDQPPQLKPGELYVLGTVSQLAVEFSRAGGMTVGKRTIDCVLGVLWVSCRIQWFQHFISKLRDCFFYFLCFFRTFLMLMSFSCHLPALYAFFVLFSCLWLSVLLFWLTRALCFL